ncbi:hypothetical protein [Corynebacterium macginleyi]|uniref:Uncharacterized protein n=1 Tax=Corynebacterium macginleyi TaxID=38290 RepID=A0ABS1Y8W8_9CORY|nr:hypothetical protein [Corynebacterium macginleyi]MBK4138283.1 hypothetical protein [Corynebacterium macginleyi]MBM0244824.1 hypothetical protein [Corynebacterium macginleyi]QRP20716.1 hypothetical protein I6J25_08370 [Corynebacterium macginleyi]
MHICSTPASHTVTHHRLGDVCDYFCDPVGPQITGPVLGALHQTNPDG